MIPRIAVTPGDPAGIGPDIVCALAAELTRSPLDAELVLIADRSVIVDRAKQLGLAISLDEFEPDIQPGIDSATDSVTDSTTAKVCTAPQAGRLSIWHVPTRAAVCAGQPNVENGGYVLDTLDRAVAGCLTGQFDGMVTGPVNKALVNQSIANAGRSAPEMGAGNDLARHDGPPTFRGHTEYLAEKSGRHLPVMMLAGPSLKVALVTTHLPLNNVAEAITSDTVANCIRILHHDLRRWFAVAQPKILVTGLNPHAGESGLLGHEDEDIILPAVETTAMEGIRVTGPVPGDTAFTPSKRAAYDVVLAMYHDQGLAVVKALDFGQVVNITLGLPILRTSVDHGTAYELAGSGDASPDSLMHAVRKAVEMAQNQTPGGR